MASKGKIGDALRVLQQVREENRAQAELKDIQKAADDEVQTERATMKDFAVPWARRIVFLGIGIAIVQQITGVNSIMYYGTIILKNAGFTTDAALIANIANGVVSVLATFVGNLVTR